MTAVVREFKLWGYLMHPTVATITINGEEVFNGSVEIIDPPPVTTPPTVTPMIIGQYNGDTELQTIAISITVISGSAGFGLIEVNEDAAPPNEWSGNYFRLPNSGRNNILINGELPQWPEDGGPTFPLGTPEDPDWFGWAFRLNTGDVLTFDYDALSLTPPAPRSQTTPPSET